MKINAELIKQYRTDRQWSQDQLSSLCGLSLRTLQRLESTGNASIESVRALAAVFNVDASQFILNDKFEAKSITQHSVFLSIKHSLMKFDDFSGKSSRFEYWWFFAFFITLAAIGEIIHPKAYMLVALILLFPFIAVGSRRLNDIGESPWLQLLLIVPFGFIPVLFYMAKESKTEKSESEILNSDNA
jgi:transcriptional regulator with XRE-family HTH domain